MGNSKMSYIEAIQQAQDLAMEHDNNVFILGEDVGRKGGVLVQLGSSRQIWC